MTSITLAPTRRWWHWLVLLVSFPLSGLVTRLLLGPVFSVPAALAGGAIVGLAVGFASALAFGRPAARWGAATTVGLVVGTVAAVLLPVAAAPLQALALGVAQAIAGPPAGRLLWGAATTAAWSAAWAVSLVVAIGDEPGFVTFGLSGALLYCAVMAGVVTIARRAQR